MRTLVLETKSVATRLRKLADDRLRDKAAEALAREMLAEIPRRIRRLSEGRLDAWFEWKRQVLTFDPRRMPPRLAVKFRFWRWRLVKLPRLVETLAYGLGILAIFRRLNRKTKRVLTFHNVLPDALCTCDMASAVTLSASAFERIVRRLRRHYRFSTDFNDASSLTLTFDDGYRCQFETAGEILERLRIPAVVFSSGKIRTCDDPRQALAVDRLLLWASHAPMESLSAFAGAETQSRELFWYETMEPAYRRDADARGEAVFHRADSLYPFDRILAELDPEMVKLRLTGPDESCVWRRLQQGWRVGWHAQSHFPLAFLSDAEAERELTPADAACLDLPVSYPYGTSETVSPREERIARERGFAGGCSNLECANVREGEFFRRRFTLTGDRIGDEAKLSGFRDFIERRL